MARRRVGEGKRLENGFPIRVQHARHMVVFPYVNAKEKHKITRFLRVRASGNLLSVQRYSLVGDSERGRRRRHPTYS